MKKYIIRETPHPDLAFYFDGDMFNENSGDFCNTLFIRYPEGWGRYHGLNEDTYQRLKDEAEEMGEYFEDVRCGDRQYYQCYKEIMLDYWGRFNPRDCHLLQEVFYGSPTGEEAMAAYLTVKTGKHWTWTTIFGYCQGDSVDILYCDEVYKDVREYGEVYLGCAKEFCVITMEGGEEVDRVYGFIIADCLAPEPADYKRLVCEWDCIPAEEAELQLIGGSHTVYDYEVIA